MKADWLHGDLPDDDTFRAGWAEYFAIRLSEGMALVEADLIRRRLFIIAVDRATKRNISLNAAADLVMFGRILRAVASEFSRRQPSATAFRAQTPPDVELRGLTTQLLGVFGSAEERREQVRRTYWGARQDASDLLDQCRDPATTGSWQELYGAALSFLVLEKVVHRWVPASRPDGSGPTDQVAQLFGGSDQERLEKLDAELEEGVADITVAMALHWSDAGQTDLHDKIIRTRENDGRLAARILLREMRQDFRVTPWHYTLWDEETAS